MEALLGLIPPRIRRGLVFIDPSYEVKTEYTEIPKKVSVGMEKWSQGIYALWYPVLSEGRHKILTEGMAALGDTNILTSEISIAQPKDGGEDNAPRLLGSGLIVVNPPWKFDASLICAGKWLAKAMTGNSDNHTTRWLKRAEGSA
jgi:23S rRNA (adenine2030-N6)-methyltransferase